MKLYNTLTRTIDDLQPLEKDTVKVYTCGLTVYSQPHIGNWLGYVYWDVLLRTLRNDGYTVEHTQNITDVGHLTSDDDNGEDKMEKGARREGVTAWDVAEKYIAIADKESAELNLTPATHLVRATDMIEQQIAFAKTLEEKGFLYRIDGDGMYFDTSSLSDYGKLARLDIDGLEPGARVSVAGKRNNTDFAVWKFSPAGSKRDMEWQSPWGVGFPGWHLECSVIARETLGDQIDIHTGGIDHIPVHHTNEIAQTEAVTGKQFSSLWLHVNHLKADGKKMSKSLGNIYTLQNITDKGFSMDDFRVFALGKHYRTEGNFTWENLEAAANRLQHWREINDISEQTSVTPQSEDSHQYLERFTDALLTDLNTPVALSVFDELINEIDRGGFTSETLFVFRTLRTRLHEMLGLNLTTTPELTQEQTQLIAEREAARTAKDWKRSDEIRDRLTQTGLAVRDTQNGPEWVHLRKISS